MEEKEKDQFEERMKKRKFYTVIALKTLIVIVGSVLSFSLGINLREKSGIRKTEKLATALVQELDHINEISESLPKREQILEETTTMVELSYTKRKYKDLKLLERAGLNAIEINRVSEIFKTLADINSTIKYLNKAYEDKDMTLHKALLESLAKLVEDEGFKNNIKSMDRVQDKLLLYMNK